LVAPGEINVLDHNPERPGHRHAIWHSNKRYYEETLKALEDRFRDQHFAAAFCSQLKTRTQRAGESLQDFATAVKQLAHCAYPTLLEDHIRREAGKANRVEDHEIKVALLIGGEKMVNKALRQAIKLQAVFPTKLAPRHSGGADRLPASEGMPGNWNAGTVENWGTSRVPAPVKGRQKMTGAGNLKIGQAETHGNHQGLNGDQVTTKK
jgi:hypothetical protein